MIQPGHRPAPSPQEHLLIIKPTALGDVAQACQVIPTIKHHRPEGRVTWVVDKDYAPLVRLCSGVDELIEFPRRRWNHLSHLPEVFRWLSYLREHGFTLAFDLQGLARSAVMTLASRARKRIGLYSSRECSFLAYNSMVKDRQRHAIDRYATAVRHLLGEEVEIQKIHLRRPGPPIYPGLKSGEYTLLHPYSKWNTKLWPWERYDQLALLHPEETFVLIGDGPFFPLQAKNIIDLRKQTTLQDLLHLTAHAKAILGTDSGPAHVAAAFGTPVITIFGATDPEKTAPRAPFSRILHGDVKCRPCLRRTCSHRQPLTCLCSVKVAAVSAALREAFAAPVQRSGSVS